MNFDLKVFGIKSGWGDVQMIFNRLINLLMWGLNGFYGIADSYGVDTI